MGDESLWGTLHESRMQRSHRMFLATLYCQRLGSREILVRDLSRQGIGGRGIADLKRGELFTIELNGEEIGALVRWTRKDRFGAELTREIDPSQFTFDHKDWTKAHSPLKHGHVFDQFRPVTSSKRPPLKLR